ncbi:hypothetical protein Aduo_018885 [Ancylostoma duodenale]
MPQYRPSYNHTMMPYQWNNGYYPPASQAQFQPGPSNAMRSNNVLPGTHLLCLAALVVIALLPTTEAQYQICGINPYSNVFSLPEAIDCTAAPNAPMIRTTKGYRDILEISMSNFFYIRTTRTILQRRRVSIPQELCQAARNTERVHDNELATVSPGLQMTKEIEEEDVFVPLWGSRKYLRSIYSLEKGQIASFDGQTIISSLGNLENCTLAQGFCFSQEHTLIWEPIRTKPFCRYAHAGAYEAFVTLRHIVLPHPDLVFQLSVFHRI